MLRVTSWMVFLLVPALYAAGTLKPVGSVAQPIQIKTHEVSVVINNGFAMTTVTQVFFNPNDRDLEAIYEVPVPQSAALSEMSILLGELELQGEVMGREQAEQVYENERDSGSDAGLASKDAFDNFHFQVSPVPAAAECRFRYVYYQPIDIDTSVGRYVYPLQDGGTDVQARSFWQRNEVVSGRFTFELVLKSGWPITAIRVPQVPDAEIREDAQGVHRVRIETTDGQLNRDLVVYYNLQEDLPGRIELLAYKPAADRDGTFMLVLTPGLDLQPLQNGADYTFVLDTSGSMSGKIQTLKRGVEASLGEMGAGDRIRIVTFSSRAQELVPWTRASEQVRVLAALSKRSAGGSTNVYDGLRLGLRDLDDDRASSMILVTDGVANAGVIEPRAFHDLMTQYDIRVFGFLMGNNANWPLMRAITNASGGFYKGISNADDIVGQILLAKSKVTHECLHDAQLTIGGINTYGVNREFLGKVYRGQQLVIFGRYPHGGLARIALKARLTGADRTYETEVDFPDEDHRHPELERLWALASIEHLEDMVNAGLMPGDECDQAVRGLGIDYQLVTDETSMVVLRDERFEQLGIARSNRDRVALERAARLQRQQMPVTSSRADAERPMFDHSAPSLGGGAFDWMHAVLASLLLLGLVV